MLGLGSALRGAGVRSRAPADHPVSPLGLTRADATGEFLADVAGDAIGTSTMRRAIQTGQPLVDRLGLIPERLDGLKESYHRRPNYTPAAHMDADHEVVREFMEDPLRMCSDGHEPFRDRVQKLSLINT